MIIITKLKTSIIRMDWRMDEWGSLRIAKTRIPVPVIISPKKRIERGPSAASESPRSVIIKSGIIINPKPKKKAEIALKMKICFNSILAIFVHHLTSNITILVYLAH